MRKGDRVRWLSWGTQVVHTGVVVAVIPPGKRWNEVYILSLELGYNPVGGPPAKLMFNQAAPPRKAESYLILTPEPKSGGGPRLHWPKPNLLARLDP